MSGGFLMTVISHMSLCFGCLFEIFLVYKYVMFPFDTCTYDVYQICALMVLLKCGIKFEWSMYFIVFLKEFISWRLVNMCSVRCNICKCWINTHSTFPKLS